MGYSGHIYGRAGLGGRPVVGVVPSSYRDYQGNQGFCYGIFRDITPIAAYRALGWEFHVFLA